MSQWQPIETAPRDGTAIFAYGTVYGAHDYADDEVNTFKCSWSPRGYWIAEQPMPRGCVGIEPTHWMPLPPPPTEQTSDSNRPHPQSGAVPKSET